MALPAKAIRCAMQFSWVYILASGRNGTLYTGVTSDLVRRVAEHKLELKGEFTKRYDVKSLVWYETHDDITAAIKHEKRIKKWPRLWKVQMIEAANPHWTDLTAQIMG